MAPGMKRTLADLARTVGGELHGADAEFGAVTIDTRRLAAGDLFMALPGSRVDGHDYVTAAAAAAAAGAVVSRLISVPLPQILVPDVEVALTRAAAAWRSQYSLPIIAVAGSNGKTTVKEMIASILARAGKCLATSGNLNNHLGVPLTLLRLEPGHRSAVVEIGANRAGEVAVLAALVNPRVGLITNAGAEHLEGFGSIEGAARAEGEMVAALGPDQIAVINADDPFAGMWKGMTRARVVTFGFAPGSSMRASELGQTIDERGFAAKFVLQCRNGTVPVELALAGRHNVQNATCAAAAALAVGCNLSQIAAGLAEVLPVNGRLQSRRTAQGALLIDDSYNANPASTLAALEVMRSAPGRRWMVLGDMAELGAHAEASHRDIGRAARELGIERLFTFGTLAALAADAFGDGGKYSDIDALQQELAAQLQPDVCLLVKGSRVNRLERLVAGLGAAPILRRTGQ
jgi:UDP-N-acetylmuramoyl-tripeptide--D-alanyl-D-alanine ligase